MENLKTQIKDIIKALYDIDDTPVDFSEVPANIAGDYSTNIAMRLAKRVGKNPRQVAEEIIAKLGDEYIFTIAGPGFINVLQQHQSFRVTGSDIFRDYAFDLLLLPCDQKFVSV